MAILCEPQHLLFIMAPHTGCTAVGYILRERLDGVFFPEQDVKDASGEVIVPRKHSQLAQLVDHGILTPERRSSVVVASTIRNPFDALVSHYVKVSKRFTADPDKRPAAAEAASSFEGWLEFRFKPGPYSRLRGRMPEQPIRWTEGSDVVMRFERLQADFDDLLRRVGAPEPLVIPQRNVTGARKKRPYQEFYTPRARRIVEQVYAADLATFGYTFDDTSG
jgi:hypothetical protein